MPQSGNFYIWKKLHQKKISDITSLYVHFMKILHPGSIYLRFKNDKFKIVTKYSSLTALKNMSALRLLELRPDFSLRLGTNRTISVFGPRFCVR